MRAIRISEWGGPEVLELVEDAPAPEPGEQDALAPFGRLVTYGIASPRAERGQLERLDAQEPRRVGFWLMHCLTRPAELVDAPLKELFERAAAGTLRIVEGETYGLSEARRAHEDLQARRTSGKLTLDPSR